MFKTVKKIIKENATNIRRTIEVARIDQKRHYSGSDFGHIWVFVKPLLYICTFYFAIELGFKGSKDIDGLICPYFIWMTAGIIAWFYIRDMITGGANCFRKYKSLMMSMKFPVSTIPVIESFSPLFVHVCMIGVVIVLALIFGVTPSLYWLEVIVYLVLMVAFSVVWSFVAGLITVANKDFLNLLRSIKPAFFWFSGILFDPRVIDSRAVSTFLKCNPITFLVSGYREAFCFHEGLASQRESFLIFFAELFVLCLIAIVLYKRIEKDIPDIV